MGTSMIGGDDEKSECQKSYEAVPLIMDRGAGDCSI
jgi:hypothetical protein